MRDLKQIFWGAVALLSIFICVPLCCSPMILALDAQGKTLFDLIQNPFLLLRLLLALFLIAVLVMSYIRYVLFEILLKAFP